ncbi:hypothetical protein [Aquimarina spinulae]|uniref:hypothetical protein n=1 Tax=Aquimarina spinulae TaxID=1192023 RepID=UPI000D54CEE4|nr:hypothetical protein [Aquimarina spinulae]
MKKDPKIYLSTLKGQASTFTFFKDIDLEITVNVKWKNNQIDEMEFVSDGKGIIKYKILDINPCKSDTIHDFYMIHLYQHTDVTIPDPSIFNASSKSHIKGLKFVKKHDSALFFFNVYSKPPSKINKCKFNQAQPETKDGSIIVSI